MRTSQGRISNQCGSGDIRTWPDSRRDFELAACSHNTISQTNQAYAHHHQQRQQVRAYPQYMLGGAFALAIPDLQHYCDGTTFN